MADLAEAIFAITARLDQALRNIDAIIERLFLNSPGLP